MKEGSFDESELVILKNKAIQSISNALHTKQLRFYKSSNFIQLACPFHGGDNPTALAIHHKISSSRGGLWYCNTRGCHIGYRGIFGFYQKLFDIPEEKVYTFVQDFTQDVDFVDVPKIEERRFLLSMSREEVRSRLEIPSAYYVERGYSEWVLDKFDVGDCLTFGKEMYRRATIPIYKGDVVIGCTGRTIGNAVPKWRNSKGFSKTQVLYNQKYNENQKEKKSVVIVESPGNVIRLAEAGIDALSILGSKMSSWQEEMIRSMEIENIVIITDNDEAGKRGRRDIVSRFSDYNVSNMYSTKGDIGDMTVEEVKKEFGELV